jgi:hypothetical protein
LSVVSVPNVTVAEPPTATVSDTSMAVKVTVSATESVAVKEATPDALVTSGVATGVITALPVP